MEIRLGAKDIIIIILTILFPLHRVLLNLFSYLSNVEKLFPLTSCHYQCTEIYGSRFVFIFVFVYNYCICVRSKSYLCHIGRVFPMAQASIVIISVQRSVEHSLRLHICISKHCICVRSKSYLCHIRRVFPMAQASIVIISVQRSVEHSLRLHRSLSHKASEAPSAQCPKDIKI